MTRDGANSNFVIGEIRLQTVPRKTAGETAENKQQ